MQPVQDICHLHSAHRLAIACDGQLLLLDQESLEGHSIPNMKVLTHVPYMYHFTLLVSSTQHAFLHYQRIYSTFVFWHTDSFDQGL